MDQPLAFRPYAEQYIYELNRFRNGEFDDNEHTKNLGRIAELVTALELQMILWDNLPEEFIELFDFPINRDKGVDMVSLDFTQTAQVKYGENKIAFAAMSTAIAYSWSSLDSRSYSCMFTRCNNCARSH
jgi:hypothetical protein